MRESKTTVRAGILMPSANVSVVNNNLMRPTDILYSCANPINAKNQLDWEAKTHMSGVIHKMINLDI